MANVDSFQTCVSSYDGRETKYTRSNMELVDVVPQSSGNAGKPGNNGKEVPAMRSNRNVTYECIGDGFDLFPYPNDFFCVVQKKTGKSEFHSEFQWPPHRPLRWLEVLRKNVDREIAVLRQ